MEEGKGQSWERERLEMPYLLTNCRNFDYRPYVPACAPKYILSPMACGVRTCVRMFLYMCVCIKLGRAKSTCVCVRAHAPPGTVRLSNACELSRELYPREWG